MKKSGLEPERDNADIAVEFSKLQTKKTTYTILHNLMWFRYPSENFMLIFHSLSDLLAQIPNTHSH